MKVDDIIIGRQVSKHLYHFEKDIGPEDLLKIIRFLAHKGREPGYLYESKRIFHTKSDLITRQEFEYVYERIEKNFDYVLSGFTRDYLVNRLGSAIKIISSTTKTEIVYKVVRDRDLLFRFFKEIFIEAYCSKWYGFKRNKTFLPAVSDQTKCLVFGFSHMDDSFSGKKYLQYWRLSGGYSSIELDRDFKTEIIGDDLTINLKDTDDIIIKNTYKFIEVHDKGTGFSLHCESMAIDTDDLEIKKAGIISYSLGIDALSAYFNLRKGSKFRTLSEGLRQRGASETVNKHLGKKFIITSDAHDIYCGIEHNREFFERIAWHLKILYLEDRKILCEVVEEEAEETITALWDILSASEHTRFCFVEI
jgi:hypothetical protein